jgi:hypothetical protein
VRRHISLTLSNPIYYGHFRFSGDVHEGKHEPIISKKLFDDVAAILGERWRWTPKETKRTPKAFTGLLRCAECGSGITAEIQKGHTYYRCTKKSRVHQCAQPYVREEVLDAEISALLKPFALRADWADEMLKLIMNESKQSAKTAAQLAEQKSLEIGALNLRLQRLLDSFLDGVVERETFAVEKAKMMSQKATLEQARAAHAAGRANWLEPFQNWVLTAKNAGGIAVGGTLQEKRGLALKIFGSNLVLDCKKARGSCVKPWSLLGETPSSGGVVGDMGFDFARIVRFHTWIASLRDCELQ